MNYEKPILFKGSMVQAIFDGHKTETRRGISDPLRFHMWEKACHISEMKHLADSLSGVGPETWIMSKHPNDLIRDLCYQPMNCRFSPAGTTLWIKETWQKVDGEYVYRAGSEDVARPEGFKWRPSVFMPWEASRLSVKVKSVGLARVCEATEEDSVNEGFGTPDQIEEFGSARNAFAHLFNQINGKPSPIYSPVKKDGVKQIKHYLSMRFPTDSETPKVTVAHHRGKDHFCLVNPWVWTIKFSKVD